MKRTIRDIGILLIFCVAFYGMTSAINLIGKEPETVDASSEYSPDRQLADEFLTKRSYLQAAKEFKKLVESDPHNGHAWFLLADSYNRIRISFLRRIADARIRPYSNAKRMEDWEKEAMKYSRLAVPAYEKSVDFRRYRLRSNIQLAGIFASLGEAEPAIEHLSTAMNQGYVSRRGINNDWQFRNLIDNPDFEELVAKELRRRNNSNRRNNSGSK